MRNTSNEEFDDFVRRQRSVSEAVGSIDWEKERKDWIAYLESLYEQIESFLKKYKDDGSIRIEYKDIELNEENIGTYFAKRMIIHIGRQEITLTPIGTLLVGFKGRVDVEGRAGKARLALVDKDAVDARSLIRVKITVGPEKPLQPETESQKPIQWVWKIVSSPPLARFIQLNAESFFQMIMEVSNA